MDGMLGFALAGVALAGSPGPATLSLAAAGAAFGVRRGFAYMAGIVIGMVAVIAVTATGVMGLVAAVPGAPALVGIPAAVYFVYLAIRTAAAPPLSDSAGMRRAPSFAGGLLLSLVNPKGYAAMAALFSGFVVVRDRLAADIAAKAIILVALIIVVNTGWLFGGAALTRVYRDPRANRAMNVAFAVLLIASVALTLLL